MISGGAGKNACATPGMADVRERFMKPATAHPTRRRGAAAVEAACVLGVFFMLLFGVFEFCRYLMVLHVANNAARDASRYASVNVGNDALAKADIQAYIDARMGGVQKNIVGYTRTVYPSNAADPNNTPWNSASFAQPVAVTISGSYRPVTPFLLLLPSSIPINITAMTGSEG